MSKDITEEILLKAGFENKWNDYTYDDHYFSFSKANKEEGYTIGMFHYGRSFRSRFPWGAKVRNIKWGMDAFIDISTVEQFNQLMELMDINFKLNEE